MVNELTITYVPMVVYPIMRACVGRVCNGLIVQVIKHVLSTDDWVCLFTTHRTNAMQ